MRHPKNQQDDSTTLLNSLGRTWLAGLDVDWAACYGNEIRQRVPLPGYPFEHERYWIDQRFNPASGEIIHRKVEKKATDIGRWFYFPGWKTALAPRLTSQRQLNDGPWLLFEDALGIGERLAGMLEAENQDVVRVAPGESFSCSTSGTYTVGMGRRNDMDALFKELRRHGKYPRNILHLWSLSQPESSTSLSADRERIKERDFYSVLHLVQALADTTPAQSARLILVTCGSQKVTGTEIISPHRATVLGLLRVIPQEIDRVDCRAIDIEIPNQAVQPSRVAQLLIEELRANTSEPIIALRGNNRWKQVYEPLTLAASRSENGRLRRRGVYLISGGLGNVGLALAGLLARIEGVRLILVGRSRLPDRDTWDELLQKTDHQSAIGRKIRAVRALESSGAEVIVFSADVADEAQMREIVAEVTARFGQLNGVIHAAATVQPQTFAALRDLDRNLCEMQFWPKIQGLMVLDRVLAGQTLDFCMITSSVASILGGLHFGAYASANAFMDAFAQMRHDPDTLPWLSVNWDAWLFDSQEIMSPGVTARMAMTPEEGIDAFSRLLGLPPTPQVVISTTDLEPRLDQWIRSSADNVVRMLADDDDEHTREPVDIAETEITEENIQERLSDLWCELLGLDQVDVDDNFFNLGGDSLLALQITSRLRQSSLADLSISTLMESPTISLLAQKVMEQQNQIGDNDRVSDLLQHIKSISPEEKKRLLAKARQQGGIGE